MPITNCAECGSDINSPREAVMHNGRIYCTACRTVCSECGEPMQPEDALYLWRNDEEPFCHQCTFSCDRCGHIELRREGYHTYDSDMPNICPDCYEDAYSQCERCDRYIHDDDISTVIVHTRNEFTLEQRWCEDCINNNPVSEEDDDLHYYEGGNDMPDEEYRPINWQTGPVHDKNRILNEYLDAEKSRHRCPMCNHESQACGDCLEIQAKARKKEELTLWVYDTEVCNYHEPIHNRFKQCKYRMPHEHPYLYYGIELEAVFADKADKAKVVHDFIVATNGLFVAEYDRSVDMTGNGAEFISRPLSYKAWTSPKTRQLLKDGIEILKAAGAEVNQPKGCGLHVHMSLLFFEHQTEKNTDTIKDDIDWMFQIFQPEVEAISDRKYTKYCMAKKDKIKQYAPVLTRDAGINVTMQIQKGNIPDSGINHDNHHYAIVKTNKTIEVRTFKSTLDVDRIIATIQFCRAIAHAARNMKITQNTTFGDIISCKEGQELSNLVNKLKLDTSKKFKNTLEVK